MELDSMKKKNKNAPISVREPDPATCRKSAVPPKNAPYDFGINRTWYQTHRLSYPVEVSDYFTYGNLPGFGPENDTPASPSNETNVPDDPDDDAGLYDEDAGLYAE